MLRIFSRLIFPQIKSHPTLLKKPSNLCLIYKPNVHFSSDEGFKVASVIASSVTQTLKRCQSFSDLFYHFDKRDRFLSFAHLAVIVRKFNELHQNKPTNPMLESNYNQILARIVHYCELPQQEIAAGDIATIYHTLSQIPYSNQFSKRCAFLVEQKGMIMFTQMSLFEIMLFFSTLAKNNKKGFAKSMIPHIIENIQDFKLSLLAKILDCVASLNIHSPELASAVQDVLIYSQRIEKLRPLEFSFVFRFFQQYPDMKEDLYRRFEGRFKWIMKECNSDVTMRIISSMGDSQQRTMSLHFFEDLALKCNYISSYLNSDSLLTIMKCFMKHKREYLIMQNDSLRRMVTGLEVTDAESLTTQLYFLTKSREFSGSLAESIVERLNQLGHTSLDIATWEYLLISLAFFSLKNPNILSQKTQSCIAEQVLSKIEVFSIEQFHSIILKYSSLFKLEDQQQIFAYFQEKVLSRELARKPSSVDLENVYSLNHALLSRFKSFTTKELINEMIDFSLTAVTQEANAEVEVSFVHFSESFSRFLEAILRVELDEAYTEKRIKLIDATAQLLIKVHYSMGSLPEVLLKEKNLVKYIKNFYSATTPPSEKLEKIFEEALNTVGLSNLTPASLEFLSEQTSLIREYDSPMKEEIKLSAPHSS